MLQTLVKSAFSRLSSRGQSGRSLLILDNAFPNLVSGFRLAEYNHYLTRYDHAVVRSVAGDFDQTWRDYEVVHPTLASRVRRWDSAERFDHHLACFVFVSNLTFFLPWLNQRRIPFVFTLYPGGNFGFDYPRSDRAILEALDSSCLRKIIVTAPRVKDYLVQLTGDQARIDSLVEEIHGMVVDHGYFVLDDGGERRRYGLGKESFDVCFVAYKTMPQAANKGYPQFLDAARSFCKVLPAARIHVVGNLGPEDGNLELIADRVTFYGPQPNALLKPFYAGMDAIVAPSIAVRGLKEGGLFFDGFPTGSCVEASLCGVAMVATDPFGLNRYYENGRDILITSIEPDAIADALIDLGRHPEKMKSVAESGRSVSQALLHPDKQLARRTAVLENCLAER